MTDLAWFRRPAGADPGTLNATYQLLDRAVVAGRAEEEVVPGRSFADLLEEVAAFAGVLRGFGLTPGGRVLLTETAADRALIAALGALRIGAVVRAEPSAEPALLIGPAGIQAAGEPGPVAWDLLMRLGRTDPAGAADLPPDAPAVGTRSTRELAEVLAAVTAPTTAEALLGALGL